MKTAVNEYINNRTIQSIREDFPILKEKIYGKPLIYLDNAATTQKPTCVVEKIISGYYSGNANIHRGVHYLSQYATEQHEKARKGIQQFINAANPYEIIFTGGTTEAINLVASTFGEACCSSGDEIIITEMEHHSNIVPWQMLKNRKGIKLKVIPFDETGVLNIDTLKKEITPKTKLIAVTHISNVLGTVNPVKEIAAIGHHSGIPVLIDGAQAIPHTKIDVQDIDADFYVFSAHKIYGPTGIGALYAKEKWLEKMPPYQGGGEMVAHVTFEKTTYNELPFKFEAGTPDFINSPAFSTALDYISTLGIENIAAYEQKLLQYATTQLNNIEGCRIIGTAEEKGSVLSFLLKDIHPYDVGMLLDKLGIAVRTGHLCAQPIIDKFNIPGTIRASLSFYNTKEEIDALITSLIKINKMF